VTTIFQVLNGASMKKILTFLTILIFMTSLLAIAFAQPRKRKASVNVNRRVTQTGGQQRSIIGAGAGAGSVYRNGRRGRYVTRNGKRIWVPQGSPRRVYEREQDAEVRRPPSNSNRP
jgi:hypothetical protein